MKILVSLSLSAFLGIGLGGCGSAPLADDAAPGGAVAAKPDAAKSGAAKPGETTSAEFAAQMQALDAKADWPTLLKSGREWQKSHPSDPIGYFTEANASYMLGEVDVSIAAWEKLVAMDPLSANQGAKWLKTARSVRRNFPKLQLKPLQFEPGDAVRQQDEWKQKGASLLAAKNYDEIERLATALQKSNAASTKGSPHLSFLFEGLRMGGANGLEATRARIAAWRAARPKSDLARLVEVQMWTDAAWSARGGGYADTITPERSTKVDDLLKKSAAGLKNLPPTAFKSPLAFMVAIDCSLLAGAPREAMDQLFIAGTRKFPDYLPLYRTRAFHLLPRWLGQPGETLAMIKGRAKQIGGDDGEIFYGRVIWDLTQGVGNLETDFSSPYPRAARGLKLLHARFPDSLSVASARLDLAFRAKEWKTAQEILSAPNGHILDSSWERWEIPHNQRNFFEQRMLILGTTVK